jgi:hypothetical protein
MGKEKYKGKNSGKMAEIRGNRGNKKNRGNREKEGIERIGNKGMI